MTTFDIRVDDLSGYATRALLALHLAEMQENSPVGHVNALNLAALKEPNVTFWSVWDGKALASIGALKDLGDGKGELKSMRTDPDHLRKGVAAALLDHIIDEPRNHDFRKISLETGSGPAFAPALALYLKRGFVEGDSFSDYAQSNFNKFYHLTL